METKNTSTEVKMPSERFSPEQFREMLNVESSSINMAQGVTSFGDKMLAQNSAKSQSQATGKGANLA